MFEPLSLSEFRAALRLLAVLACTTPLQGLAAVFQAGDAQELVSAIEQANADGDADVIELIDDIQLLGANSTLDGDNGLPVVTSAITLHGNGHTIERSTGAGTPEFRIFAIAETGELSVTNVVIYGGRQARAEGGAFFNAGKLTIAEGWFAGNVAYNGGAIANRGTLQVTASSFHANEAASQGGAIHCAAGSVSIARSEFHENAAEWGGALHSGLGPCSLAVDGSAIQFNRAQYGGGIHGAVTLTNSTVAGNTALVSGGGLRFVTFAAATIRNSTIAENSASGLAGGGGICKVSAGPSDVVVIDNSIVALNSQGGNCGCDPDGDFVGAHNLDDDGTCFRSTVASVGLGPLGANGGPTISYGLLPGSPAIDAGDNELVSGPDEVDQRGPGYARIFNGTVDIGAVEFRRTVQETPQAPSSLQSGVGLIRGWACEAESVAVVIDGGDPINVAYGTQRADTTAVCGDADNGYGMVIAWDLLNTPENGGGHELTALVDGVAVSTVVFEAFGLGEGFVEGLAGEFYLDDFPAENESVRISWSEADQNFVITGHDSGNGFGRAGLDFVDPSETGTFPDAEALVGGARHESPAQHSVQSGVGLIRGWACDAEEVSVSIDDGETIPIAWGTSRADTLEVCADEDNGYGMVIAWSLLGDGVHRLRTFVDGTEIADVEFEVVTIGGEFLEGLQARYRVPDFPESGMSVEVVWSEADQNFRLVNELTDPSPPLARPAPP